MGWTKREAVTNLVVLGDGNESDKKKIGGLLIGCPPDRMYPDKVNYEIVQKDGEVALLSGSATLARQINDLDIGKFIKCEFLGWGKSANGKFKMIDVMIWEGEPTDDMKKWPQFGQHSAATAKPKANTVANALTPNDADDFAASLEDTDDDLPF